MTKVYTITVSDPICDKALEWAKENCPSYTTNTAYSDDGEKYIYKFFFYKEKDAVFFALRWSSS
jgi:hypothetical protein